ncbi:MAG: hypothetical protein AAF191_07090, partial [Verrucomicrobiota bacterium]
LEFPALSRFSPPRDGLMDQQFVHFLQHPDLNNFLSLRNALLVSADFNPYSRELTRVDSFLKARQADEAERLLRSAMTPNHLISPGAHLRLGLAYEMLGQTEAAQRERAIGMRCLEGILFTGSGSRQEPYLVTRTSDEYDVLLSQRLQFLKQALVKENSRHLDVIETKDGQQLHFDVTDIFQIAKSRLSLRSS